MRFHPSRRSSPAGSGAEACGSASARSGRTSNAQARLSAIGNPSKASATTSLSVHSGNNNAGKITEAASTAAHATTVYTTATRTTLRRSNSAQNLLNQFSDTESHCVRNDQFMIASEWPFNRWQTRPGRCRGTDIHSPAKPFRMKKHPKKGGIVGHFAYVPLCILLI